jgi:hypothetical protein
MMSFFTYSFALLTIFALSIIGSSEASAQQVSATTITTAHDTIPRFCANPTHTSLSSGDWSNPSIWSGGQVPGSGAKVNIAAGTTVKYDAASSIIAIDCIEVNGIFTFSVQNSTQLLVTTLMVMPSGSLIVGTPAQPIPAHITAEIIIADTPLQTGTTTSPGIDPKQYGNGIIGLGTVTMHGAQKNPTFVQVAQEPKAGQTTVAFAQPVNGWKVGDKVIVPDTRHLLLGGGEVWAGYRTQVEERIVASIAADNRSISLKTPLIFDHVGARNPDGVLEFLPHVGNLTRNVVIRSENPGGVPGHTMFTHRAAVDIRYVQFQNMGRTTNAALHNTNFDASGNITQIGTNQIGRYGVHIHHLMGPVNATNTGHQFTLIGNAVKYTPKWAITVHNSHYGLVKDNVVYDSGGAGIVTEDGNETENEFDHNFVVHSHGVGSSRDGTGRYGASFWFAGFNHIVRNNIASGANSRDQGIVSGVGYDFVVPPAAFNMRIPLYRGADTTTGRQGAEYRSVSSRALPIKEFSNNEAYGAMSTGLALWNLGTDGYGPTNITASTIKNSRFWHMYAEGAWMYPVHNIVFDGYVVRGHPRALVPNSGMAGWQAGDYWAGNVTIRNADMQNVTHGIGASTNTPGAFTIEDSYFRSQDANIVINTLNVPGTRAATPPRQWIIRNNKFVPYLPGRPLTTITAGFGGTNVVEKDEIFVYDYQQVPGQNFQVFYKQQDQNAPILPTTFRGTNANGTPIVDRFGCPAAPNITPPPRTNRECWDTYAYKGYTGIEATSPRKTNPSDQGVTTAGAFATCTDDTTRPEVKGFTCPIGASVPPPAPRPSSTPSPSPSPSPSIQPIPSPSRLPSPSPSPLPSPSPSPKPSPSPSKPPLPSPSPLPTASPIPSIPPQSSAPPDDDVASPDITFTRPIPENVAQGEKLSFELQIKSSPDDPIVCISFELPNGVKLMAALLGINVPSC